MRIKRTSTYELINSEGPILIFELSRDCGIFIFPEELGNTRVHRDDLMPYLTGRLDIRSPFGRTFNLADPALADGIIRKNLNSIIEQLNANDSN